LGIYGVAFLFFADVGVQIEFWAMRKPARFLVLSAIFLATAVLANRHTAEFAAAPDNRIQFEDLPPAEVFALDLRHDGTWSNF